MRRLPYAEILCVSLRSLLRALLEHLARLSKLTQNMTTLAIRTPSGMGLGLLSDIVDPADEILRIILRTDPLAAPVHIDRARFADNIRVVDGMLRFGMGGSKRDPAAAIDRNSLTDRSAVARLDHLSVEVNFQLFQRYDRLRAGIQLDRSALGWQADLVPGNVAVHHQGQKRTIRHERSSSPDRLQIARPFQLVTDIRVEPARSYDRRRMQAENRVFPRRSGYLEAAVQRLVPDRSGPGEVVGAGEDLQILEGTQGEVYRKSSRHGVPGFDWIARPRMDVSSESALLSRRQEHVRV